MNDTEFILAHLEKIAVNLEELVSFLTPEQSAIYVDGAQQVNLIRVEDALAICNIAQKAPNTLVLGSRKLKENVPLRSKFGNTVTRFVYYISTGLKVHDTQTGLRAFRAELIPVLRDIPGERYEYEMNYYFVLPVIRFGFWSMRLKRSILIIMPSLILIR